MKIIRIITTSLLILCATVSYAVSKDVVVRGKVNSSVGNAIPFANVYCVETKEGTTADEDGNFSLSITMPESAITLYASFVGYETTKISVPIQNLEAPVKISMPRGYNLEEVVAVGEIKPTSVDSSIYKVKLISEAKIKASGSQSLNDLLMTEANIRMSTDLILGSQIEMMGLGGQNVKVMIDGVSIIGRLDGNLDLSQVRLDDIAQVEIVEGPMSVVYGNNAIAGTINLITKKNNHHKLETQVQAYAESVGKYTGSVRMNKRIGDKHNLGVNVGTEWFGGVDFDETTRSQDWKPKRQYFADLLYAYKTTKWDLDLKGRYYTDRLDYEGDIVQTIKTYNTYYFTDRFDVGATINRRWRANKTLNVVTSYNHYDRYSQAYTKDLSDLSVIYSEKEKSQTMNQALMRAIYMQTFNTKLSMQTGLDLNYEEMIGSRIKDEAQSMGDYAGFINLKYMPISKLYIMPGLRYAYNTSYSTPLVYSMNVKWDIIDNLSWRTSFAKGFRAPDIKELYMEFVNSNHEIYGNEDLKAESSYNLNSSVDYRIIKENSVFKWNATFFYNDIENMISLTSIENSTGYSYYNIDMFRTNGLSLNFDYKFKNIFNPYVGYGYTGRYNSHSDTGNGNKYNPTHDFFAGLKAYETNTKVRLTIDYKLNGKLPYFFTEDEEVKEGLQESYDILNASISRQFSKPSLNVVLGVRNAFDVTSVQRATAGTAHSSGSGGVPISYGRSFYISLIYKLYK
ncbi:MAG: TonB-dependent receptor [Mangrovibacterium sp.]